jgi:hypothetical protein
MLENIQALSLADKKTLLAMLQADIGLKVEVEFTVEKPSFYQLETRRCNAVAKIKKSGGSVIYTDLQMVD